LNQRAPAKKIRRASATTPPKEGWENLEIAVVRGLTTRTSPAMLNDAIEASACSPIHLLQE